MKSLSFAVAALIAPFVALGNAGSSMPKVDRATAPIVGAFGFRLGEVYTPDANAEAITSSVITEQTLPGALYRVTPPAGEQRAPFNEYFILRTLKTHQIAAIYAAATPDCFSATGAGQTIARELAQEYSRIPTLPLQIRDGARQIVLQCTPQVMKLVYADVDLAYTYAREAAEIESADEAQRR